MENINSNINSSQENPEFKNEIQINNDNNNNQITEEQKQTKNNFNIKNKYDCALLEELQNPKTRSWRIDLIKNTKKDDKENNNKLNENNFNDNQKLINEKDEVNKYDRFKDFDDILLLEENKDKKKKNIDKEKLIRTDNEVKIQNSIVEISNNKNEKDNIIQRLSQENNINKNSSTISELNKFIENRDLNTNNENLEKKIYDTNEINKNSMNNFKNQKKSSNLSRVINENTNNSIEKNNNDIYKNINLEYSEDKKSYEEINEKNIINNKIENSKNNIKKIRTLYNNFFNINDKVRYNDYENDTNINRLNRNLFGNNNIKEKNENNNKKINKHFHVSKST